MYSEIKGFLLNYAKDLIHSSGDGLDMLNARTAGTPYFETEKELRDYIERLEQAINLL